MKFAYIVCGLLICFSGCSQYMCWIRKTFDQATEANAPICSARAYVRSRDIYDRFATVALIDVLPVTAQVYRGYNELRALRCLDQRLFPEVDFGQTAFYIMLLPIDEGDRLSLTDERAHWGICLHVDGQVYKPQSIKEVRLEPEYQAIFGSRYTRYRRIYLVKFPVEVDGKNYMKMVFTNFEFTTELEWCDLNHMPPAPSCDVCGIDQKITD